MTTEAEERLDELLELLDEGDPELVELEGSLRRALEAVRRAIDLEDLDGE